VIRLYSPKTEYNIKRNQLIRILTRLKITRSAATNTQDKREKIQALSLAKECYAMKLDLLTNATVVDDAIRFVADKQNVQSKDRAVTKCNEVDRVTIIENGIQDNSSTTKNCVF